MSGIAGIVRLDDAPAEQQHAHTLQQAIAHRGPDATGSWHDDRAVLVHTMLHTSVESLRESQPLIDDNLAIVGDLRLDYREQLWALLDIAPREGRRMGDAQLVAAAYRRWGARCPAYLDGDFAFGIWDARERKVFCARDAFGVKPLVYCMQKGRVFAFASQIRALLALDDIPRQLDEQRIADFLSVHFRDTERTFYRHVSRLPGGCSLSVQAGKLQVDRYWSPDRVRPLRLSSTAEYTDGYREHFGAAVRTRMRVPYAGQLGSMLSGGLDSSAVTCLARDEMDTHNQPLPVFCWVFSDEPAADEREYQDIVVEAGRLNRHTLDSATAVCSPWAQLDPFLPDGPLYAPNFYLNLGAAKVAQGLGIRALLDGLGGDSTISHGTTRLMELLWSGRVGELTYELRARARHQNVHASMLRLLANVVAPVVPPTLLQLSHRMRVGARGHPSLQLLSSQLRKAVIPAVLPYNPQFTARQRHLADLSSPMLGEGLELFDRVLAECRIEGRYPFFDRRLAEYCLSLPSDQKFSDGYSRMIARRAMEGSVPSAVQWRTDKGKPGLHLIRAMRLHRERLDALFLQDPGIIAPYVNVDLLRDLYRDFVAERPLEFVSVIRLWSAGSLGLWLQHAHGNARLICI